MADSKISQVGILVLRNFSGHLSISGTGGHDHPYIGALKDLAVLDLDWDEQLAYLADTFIQIVASSFEEQLARQSAEKMQMLNSQILNSIKSRELIAGPTGSDQVIETSGLDHEEIAALIQTEFSPLARRRVALKARSPNPRNSLEPYLECLMMVACWEMDWRQFLSSLREVYKEHAESEVKRWLELQTETSKMERRALATATLGEWETRDED